MGTTSTVKFYNGFKKSEPILCVYNKFDGYISGVGFELAKFLKSKKLVNGFRHETMEGGFANGMGCLAAQFVAKHKTEIGNLYLTTREDSQDYDYEVRLIDGEFQITVDDFEGTPEELLNFKEQ